MLLTSTARKFDCNKKVQFFDPIDPKPKPKPTAFLHLIFLFCLFLQPPPFSPPPKNVIGAQEVHKDKAITPPPPKKREEKVFFYLFPEKGCLELIPRSSTFIFRRGLWVLGDENCQIVRSYKVITLILKTFFLLHKKHRFAGLVFERKIWTLIVHLNADKNVKSLLVW